MKYPGIKIAAVAAALISNATMFAEIMSFEDYEHKWGYSIYDSCLGEEEEVTELVFIMPSTLEDAQKAGTITFPDALKSDEAGELYEITRMVDVLNDMPHIHTVVLPKFLTAMGGCINDCPDVTTIIFGDKLENIALSCSNLPSLTEIELPMSISTIGDKTFNNLNIQTLNLHNIKHIGSHSLSCLYGIKRIVIPAGTVSVKEYSFCNLPLLEEVTLPDGSEEGCTLSARLFLNCPNLTRIYAPSPTPLPLYEAEADFGSENSGGEMAGIDKSRCTLYVPTGAAHIYSTNPAWNGFNIEEYDFTANAGSKHIGYDQNLLQKRLKTQHNGLSITGCKGQHITVHSIDGTTDYSGNPQGDIFIPLSNGIFIVTECNNAIKAYIHQ